MRSDHERNADDDGEGTARAERAGRGPAPGYGGLVRVFLRISLLGFGGPNAHLALMLDEVVERRGWLTREHFLHLVGITNLLPGPNSSEVAIHIGYTQRGWRGALATGLTFLAPTFVLVVAFSALYFRYGALPAVEDVFWALKPVIVAIILGAGWKLGRAAVTDARLLALAAGGVTVALLLDRWEVAAMAVGGAMGWAIFRREERGREHPPDARAPSGEPSGVSDPAGSGTDRSGRRGESPEGGADADENRDAGSNRSPGRPGARGAFVAAPLTALAVGELGRIFLLTLGTGAVLFGGGYMLVALIEPYAVDAYGWITREQLLDGVALTQAVPGPIVTLVAFIGYAVAGVAGAAVATAGIYIPSFAAVLAVAPFLDRWRSLAGVRAALKGVNAVVAGAIFGVGLTLLPAAVPDPVAGSLFAVALVAQLGFGVGASRLVLVGLAAGLLRLAVAA